MPDSGELARLRVRVEAQRCVLAALIGRLLTARVLSPPALRAIWADATASGQLADLPSEIAPHNPHSVATEIDHLMQLMAPALRRPDG